MGCFKTNASSVVLLNLNRCSWSIGHPLQCTEHKGYDMQLILEQCLEDYMLPI